MSEGSVNVGMPVNPESEGGHVVSLVSFSLDSWGGGRGLGSLYGGFV